MMSWFWLAPIIRLRLQILLIIRGGPVGRIQDSFHCIRVKYCLTASGSLQFSGDIPASFFFGNASHVVIHNDPLAQGFMGALVKGGVQPWLSHQQYHRKIPRIHFKVEHDLKIRQYFMAEHVCLIDHDHGSDTFFQGIPFNLTLYVIKKFIFPEMGFSPQPGCDLAVEIHDCQGREAAVENFEQGRVQ